MADRRGRGLALVAVAALAVWVATTHPGAVDDAVAWAEQVASSIRPAAARPISDPGDATGGADVVDVAAARALLDGLPVKGRAPKTGYDRDQFGQAWADVDRNGCDTRNDILGRDMVDETFKPGTHDCVVLTGVLSDPYTGETIDFRRGQDTSAAVQIDHRVPLSNAWQTGAQQWDAATRERFANDPANLAAVDGPTNSAKGDGDAATWLPPNTSYRCAYVAAQLQVKAKYGLWVTAPEHDAIARILDRC